MKKKIAYSILAVFSLFIVFALWMSPSLGGLIPGGKNVHDNSVGKIDFDKESTGQFTIEYYNFEDEPKFAKLRQSFHLDSIINKATSEFEKVLLIQSWVQSRWIHDGNNASEQKDAFYILTEANKGRRFRCVEYSLVASECLQSLGFKVRNLGLMTKDINEVNFGAGHVVNEVFLEDLQKWILIDPQYDVIVMSNNVPLNAVETQEAIVSGKPIEVINPNKVISKDEYIKWVGPYLYYFTTSLNQGKVGILDRIIGRKKQLTLVPNGAESPKYFQRLFRINTSYFTHSKGDFYPVP